MRNRENIVIFNIKDVESEYTGGGIWCFTGQLSDGTYFLFDSDNFDLRLVNERPDPETCWYAY